jgi:hypothetical protein
MANTCNYSEVQLNEIVDNYLKFVPTQKFIKKEYNQKLDIVKDIELNKPPTVMQFCLFAAMSRETYYYYLNKEFDNVKNTEQYKLQCKLSDTITRVNEFIKEYQIAGAMLNELNPMLVARINGINEQININQNTTIQALPVSQANNIIDLTDMDFTILNE